ncbi:hypothetical protein B0H63DRAFT_540787 [Podospora didyma]|uniref:C2H2-type domain-containing protein n=1 Tax=Podospora didyma TaxID=330526 RepID=A0AAE0U0U0_9PEZI|nr:hypothetical protein B0H63DRAFT_540787 [Podospora didyma]
MQASPEPEAFQDRHFTDELESQTPPELVGMPQEIMDHLFPAAEASGFQIHPASHPPTPQDFLNYLFPDAPGPKSPEAQESAQVAALPRHERIPSCTEDDVSVLRKRPVVDEGIFTDSGYASAPTPATPAAVAKSRASSDAPEPNSNEDGNEAKTTYSAESTDMSSLARQCISEVCRDVYDKIGRHVTDTKWTTIASTMPGLIKAFAIKLGEANASDWGRRVRHFVHKNHKQVATELQHMFHDDNPGHRVPDSNAMSLLDKMRLWSRQSSSVCPTLEDSQLYEGVEDEDGDDDEIDHHELSEYSKMIIASEAYDWLIGSLLKEASFHWDEGKPRTMIDAIRKPILASLPKGTISKRRDPTTHTVLFSLYWCPIRLRLGEEYCGPNAVPDRPISKFVVFTGSSTGQVQATTVEEYFNQTWASGGRGLLEAISGAAEGQSLGVWVEKIVETSHTKIRAKFKVCNMARIYPDLLVAVDGPAYFIAECGEQLAWLQAALQPSHAVVGSVLYTTPIVEPLPESSLGFFHHRGWDIHARGVCTSHDSQLSGIRLEGCLTQPVIANGFPIRRRPESCSGLELSADILLQLVGTPSLEVSEGCYVLRGPLFAVGLVKQTAGFLVWHVLCTATASSHPCLGHIGAIPNLLNIDGLCQYRHIIEPCKYKTPVEIFDTATGCSGEGENTPTSSGPEDGTSTSAMVTDANNSYLDSDMLSIPDGTSDDGRSLSSAGATLTPVIGVVVNRLMSEYRGQQAAAALTSARPCTKANCTNSEECPIDAGDSSSSGGQSRGGGTETASATSSAPVAPKKRAGVEANKGGGDGERAMPPPKITKPGQRKTRPKTLACPFWKRDPFKHIDCFKHRLTKIAYVKQHIDRKHAPKFYCTRCFIIFPDQQCLNHHDRNVICRRDPSASLDGITYQQHRQLTRKSQSHASDAEKWFAVWDIVFPDTPRPSSAYVNQDLSQDLCLFQEFEESRGSAILLEELRASGIPSLSDEETSSTLARVLRQGLSRVHEQWLAAYTSSSSTRSTTSNPASDEPTNQGTPPSSLGDSGVILRSHVATSDSDGRPSQATSSQQELGPQPVTINNPTSPQVNSVEQYHQHTLDDDETPRANFQLQHHPPDASSPPQHLSTRQLEGDPLFSSQLDLSLSTYALDDNSPNQSMTLVFLLR